MGRRSSSYEKRKDETASAIYEQLAIEDIQQAADILRPVYDESDAARRVRQHGGLALPRARHASDHRRGDSPVEARSAATNLMIKVPATPEGIPAIRQLISQGINVNITLLFSRAVCRQVAEAYMDGLEALAAHGGDLTRIASVASMFVSRLDVLVDPMLEARTGADRAGSCAASSARWPSPTPSSPTRTGRSCAAGRAGRRWPRAAPACSACLWASTSAKDPRFSDVLYVESLIGPDTVDTIPPATLDAFRDHGKAESRLEEDVDEAQAGHGHARAAPASRSTS